MTAKVNAQHVCDTPSLIGYYEHEGASWTCRSCKTVWVVESRIPLPWSRGNTRWVSKASVVAKSKRTKVRIPGGMNDWALAFHEMFNEAERVARLTR